MQVYIDKFKLAGGGSESVNNFRKNGQTVIQEVYFFRGPERKTLDRGNKATVITFEVTRLHRDVRDAELFVLEHDDQVPRQGLVTFIAVGSGGARAERYLQAASISVVDSSYRGATTIHSYEILGGILLTKPPIASANS